MISPRTEEVLRRGAGVLRRTAPGPMLFRLTALLAGTAALILALAGPMRANPWTYVVVLAVALIPAVRPGGPWVTVVELGAAGLWVFADLVYREGRGITGALVLAALLYLHHSACALAAALPNDGRLAPGVLLGWLTRTGVVLLGTAALTVVVLLVLPPAGTGHGGALFPALGMFAAVAAGVAVAYLLHRRR